MMPLFKTGPDRHQSSLLPARVEDHVGPGNPVRAIDAYVGSLDLAGLGVRHAARTGGVGQPPFDPADLLKLYVYGYTNQVRSSRRLEREAGRNLELIWLLRGLVPSFRTIAAFRADNAAALRAACRGFVVLLRTLDLVGGEVVAIDGAFFDGNASKASIATRKRLDEQLATAERDIAAYEAQLDANDAAEADPAAAGALGRLQALLARRAAAQAGLAQLDASGQTQLSRTDPDARLLSKGGQGLAGYNVQIAVDARHKLIVASEVVHNGNDTGQLHRMAVAAQQRLGEGAVPATGEAAHAGALTAGALTAGADAGYHNGDTLRSCEADGIIAYVPEPERGERAKKAGRFGEEAFAFDPAANLFRCPGGQQLKPCGDKRDAGGKRIIRYASRRGACRACPRCAQAACRKATRREAWRWEHADVTDRHRARMAQEGPRGGAAMMQRRKALAEHPFGTLKCRAGYRHFLVRGFHKVRGEWGLMALCYNLTRVLTILGLQGLVAALVRRALCQVMGLPWPARRTLGRHKGRLTHTLHQIVRTSRQPTASRA